MGGMPPIGESMDPPVEKGREGEKRKEGSLGWGVLGLLFALKKHWV